MDVKYIVGRPLKVGADTLEPGATLTKKQVSLIPRIESYLATRRLYQVVSDADAARLPGFLRHAMNTKAEANAVIAKSRRDAVGPNAQDEESYAQSKTNIEALEASKAAALQDLRYAIANGDSPSVINDLRKKATELQKEIAKAGEVESAEERAAKKAIRDEKKKQTYKVKAGRLVTEDTEEDAALEDGQEPAEGDGDEEAKGDKDKAKKGAEDAAEPQGEAAEDVTAEVDEAAADVTPAFDPAEYSVAQVKQYIEEHPDEKDAVLALEAAGKARKSLLED